jgi:hypothetical protein
MDVVKHEFINKLGIKTVYPLGIAANIRQNLYHSLSYLFYVGCFCKKGAQQFLEPPIVV